MASSFQEMAITVKRAVLSSGVGVECKVVSTSTAAVIMPRRLPGSFKDPGNLRSRKFYLCLKTSQTEIKNPAWIGGGDRSGVRGKCRPGGCFFLPDSENQCNKIVGCGGWIDLNRQSGWGGFDNLL